MRMTIDSYKERAGRLDLRGINFDDFRIQPLDDDSLRCLEYMHDIEYHTSCYLRDLLLGPVHREPEITAFLSCWAFEEMWHGEAIADVLRAHGRGSGNDRVANLRQRTKAVDNRRLISHLIAANATGTAFVAVHMAWGAINEWTTQSGYARLSARAGHPTLRELLTRIMRQEGRHIDFYASQASDRLRSSAVARRLTRFALRRLWRPVGSGVMPETEVSFLVRYLFGGDEGRKAAERIDRQIGRLPGLEDLQLVSQAVASREPEQRRSMTFPTKTRSRLDEAA